MTTTEWAGAATIVDGPGGYTGVEATPEWAEEVRRWGLADLPWCVMMRQKSVGIALG